MLMTMATMPVVHEEMHQRAGEQQQVRQGTDDMRQVLRQQEIARDGAEHDQAESVSGAPEWRFVHLTWPLIVFVVHLNLQLNCLHLAHRSAITPAPES